MFIYKKKMTRIWKNRVERWKEYAALLLWGMRGLKNRGKGVVMITTIIAVLVATLVLALIFL